MAELDQSQAALSTEKGGFSNPDLQKAGAGAYISASFSYVGGALGVGRSKRNKLTRLGEEQFALQDELAKLEEGIVGVDKQSLELERAVGRGRRGSRGLCRQSGPLSRTDRLAE